MIKKNYTSATEHLPILEFLLNRFGALSIEKQAVLRKRS